MYTFLSVYKRIMSLGVEATEERYIAVAEMEERHRCSGSNVDGEISDLSQIPKRAWVAATVCKQARCY